MMNSLNKKRKLAEKFIPCVYCYSEAFHSINQSSHFCTLNETKSCRAKFQIFAINNMHWKNIYILLFVTTVVFKKSLFKNVVV